MGFDLTGIKPLSDKGEYFRNNVWWWRPLWEYVYEQCKDILDMKDTTYGSYNNGHKISNDKAIKIAIRLKALVAMKHTKDYEIRYKHNMEQAPDEQCDLCLGTGKRIDMIVDNGCNKCNGSGMVRPFYTSYHFNEDNVIEFAEFCEESGGFEIW